MRLVLIMHVVKTSEFAEKNHILVNEFKANQNNAYLFIINGF